MNDRMDNSLMTVNHYTGPNTWCVVLLVYHRLKLTLHSKTSSLENAVGIIYGNAGWADAKMDNLSMEAVVYPACSNSWCVVLLMFDHCQLMLHSQTSVSYNTASNVYGMVVHADDPMGNSPMEGVVHYDGPSNCQTSSLHNTFGNTHKITDQVNQPIDKPNQATDHPSTNCLWLDTDSMPCLTPINGDDVPEHFKAHDIKNKKRKSGIACLWNGCRQIVTRHNFVRHIREVHLGYERPP
ncbi:hypothetical protein J3A83DRAFT_447883 [Scleroderma citrinum]